MLPAWAEVAASLEVLYVSRTSRPWGKKWSYTRVLDTYEFGAEPEEEESAEQVDLAYWQKKTNPESLKVVEAIKVLTPTSKGEPRVTYNKHHIALGTSGYNFCWFHPRRAASYCHMHIKVGAEKRPEIIKGLEEAGIEAGNHSRDSIRLHLNMKDIQEHRPVVADVINTAEELSHR